MPIWYIHALGRPLRPEFFTGQEEREEFDTTTNDLYDPPQGQAGGVRIMNGCRLGGELNLSGSRYPSYDDALYQDKALGRNREGLTVTCDNILVLT